MTSSEAWAWVAANQGMVGDAVNRFRGDRVFGTFEDAFQEACVAVARAMRVYDPEPRRGSLRGLVYTSVKNHIANHANVRACWRRGGRSVVGPLRSCDALTDDGRGRPAPDPSRGIEVWDEVEHALQRFSGWHRDVLIRVYLRGEDPEAVAASIGYPAGGRRMMQSLNEAIRARRGNPTSGKGTGAPQKRLVPA